MKKFQRFAIVSLIRLYPLSWRNRYKEEFLALLEDYPLSWRVLFDVFWGAIQAHLNKTGKEWRPVREISKRLVFLALVGLVATYVTWLFASGIEQIFLNLAETPTIGPNPAHQFIITQVYSGLIINIMFAFFGGVLFTSPFAIYSLLGFLDKRKRFASRLGPIGPDDLNHWQLNRPGWNKNPAILLSIPLLTACWILGVIIAYLVTLPITFHLLFDYTPIFVENYMPTMGKLALLTGLVFEIPAFLFLLTASNLVEWKKIRKWWAAALLLSVIVAVLMTPSLDLLSVTIATLFIFGLYWLGIMVAWIGSKKYSEKPAEEIGK